MDLIKGPRSGRSRPLEHKWVWGPAIESTEISEFSPVVLYGSVLRDELSLVVLMPSTKLVSGMSGACRTPPFNEEQGPRL